MPAECAYDYAIVRVVPRVERGEFLNVGVILSCPEHQFLEARIALDEARLRALWPDIDLGTVQAHLAVIPRVCRGDADAGPIGALSPRQRFHWLVAPRSTIIQTSPVHAGRTTDPAATLDRVMKRMVEVEGGGRRTEEGGRG